MVRLGCGGPAGGTSAQHPPDAIFFIFFAFCGAYLTLGVGPNVAEISS